MMDLVFEAALDVEALGDLKRLQKPSADGRGSCLLRLPRSLGKEADDLLLLIPEGRNQSPSWG